MRAFLSLFFLSLLAAPGVADARDGQNRCPFGDGQRIGAGLCMTIRPMQASKSPELGDVEHLKGPALRQYCPNVVARQRVGNGKVGETTVELPADSMLYEPSNCCPSNHPTLATEPARHRFSLRLMGRDCFGGTAMFDVQEFYRLDKGGKVSLRYKVDRTHAMMKALSGEE